MPSDKDYDKILEGMWAATGKSHYNPETDTNWCHLPMEMRSECIKRMDLKTRSRLRGTSKTEKSLVESTKCHLRNFKMDVELSGFTVSVLNEFSHEEHYWKLADSDDMEIMLPGLTKVLEGCEIDTFELSVLDVTIDEYLNSTWMMLPRAAPFRFKTVKLTSTRWQALRFFLRKCEGVEQVFVDNHDIHNDEYEMGDLFNLPSVINAKFFQFAFLGNTNTLFELVQKWIDNDAEIGKKMRFALHGHEDKPIEQFKWLFENRVISKNQEEVRISTNDKSKHVILRCDKRNSCSEYFSCTIIPSDLLEDGEWGEKCHKKEFGENKCS